MADRAAPRSILPIAPWGSVKPFVERYDTLTRSQIVRRGAGCRRLWFVSSHEGQPDGPAQSVANRGRFLGPRAGLPRALGRGPMGEIGYAGAIHSQLMTGPKAGGSRRGRSAR